MNRLERLRHKEKQRVAYQERLLADPSLPSFKDYMDSLKAPEPEAPEMPAEMPKMSYFEKIMYKQRRSKDPTLPSLEEYMASLPKPPPPFLLPPQPIPVKEMSQRDRLRIKNEGLEDLPRLIHPVVYPLPIDYSSPGIGSITFPSGLVLTGSWTFNHGINRLEKVTNPTRKINIMDILPVIRLESIVNHLFYSALDYDPEDDLALFFKKLRVQTHVRIIAMCHGCVLEPFKAPCKVTRLSAVPSGFCNFTSIISKLEVMRILTPIEDDLEFKTVSQDYLTMHMRNLCKSTGINPINKREHDKMVAKCSSLEFSPEKVIDKGKFMFNKKFDNNPGLNLLYIGFMDDGQYKYKNLFSVSNGIMLSTIFEHYIPKCTDCIMVDFGCSPPCRFSSIPDAYFDMFGGTRKKKKRKERNLKNINKPMLLGFSTMLLKKMDHLNFINFVFDYFD
jgi:hypothetical protein